MHRIVFSLVFVLLALKGTYSQTFNILDFGAKSSESFVNTESINNAIKQCSSLGGGMVIIPKGKFITGTIHLKSNVNLHLETGSYLIGSKDVNHYDIMPEGYYYSGKNLIGLIFANDVENISITGEGVLDGRGTSFMKKNTRFAPSKEERRYTRQKEEFREELKLEDGPLKFNERPGHILTISNSENILIQNIRFIDAPKWTIRIGGSNNVKISQITINNNILIPNSDGIHITSSTNVNVSNSNIIAGDDALIVTGFKSGMEKYTFGNNSKEAKNIIFDNCIVTSRSSGIRVGYGEKPISNVIFSNIIINDSNRGIGIFSRNDSDIRNISFSNIFIETRLHSDGWWGKSEPIHISAIKSSTKGNPGIISDISFNNINAFSESGVVIYGENINSIKNVKINDLRVKLTSGIFTNKYGGNFDLRPSYSIEKGLFANEIPAFYAKGIKNLELNDILLEWENPLFDFFTNGLEIENFENFSLRNFKIHAAFDRQELYDIKISNGKNYKLFDDLSFNKETKIKYPTSKY
jgi:polygalacturonase